MGNLGPMELLIIAGIALLVFGAGRIADIGKGLGQGIRNFKQGLKEVDDPPSSSKGLPAESESASDRNASPSKKA